MDHRSAVLALVAALAVTAPAAAKAAGACPGPKASAGTTVHGPVLQIPDDGVICVALGQSPSTWTQVRLPRPAPARSTLMAAAFAKNVSCVIGLDGAGSCLIEGEPLSAALQRAKTLQASMTWR